MSIVVKDLVKRYGDQLALDNVSFETRPGKITGFLGPNGAGKSTTMKIANGYISPTSGDVFVGGKSVVADAFHARQHIGYLPENNPLYLDMYVREFLRFIGSAYGIGGQRLTQRVEEIIELVGLQAEKHKQLKTLSKGYRQRVGLGQALLPDPEVLILDEPTTGLDPNQLVEVRQLIKDVAAEKTLIFSTHIMQEVEAVCDHVVIISKGKIVADDTLSALSRSSSDHHVLLLQFDEDVETATLQGIAGVLDIAPEGQGKYMVKCTNPEVRREILKVTGEKGLPLASIKASGGSLEEIFKKLTS